MSDQFIVDRSRLRTHLAALSRPRDAFQNPGTLKEIQGYIHQTLEGFGYKIEKCPFSFRGESFENLIAMRHPAQRSPYLLIGAHFDAVAGTPGADDNASGVAALLEIARLVAEEPCAHRIKFIAFNVEEYGMVGSSFYAKQLKKRGEPIAGMLSLEMIGYTSNLKGSQKLPLMLRPFYPDTGNFLALVGDAGSKTFLDRAKKFFGQVQELAVETLSVPGKGWLLPETRLSDHSPFWDEGFPALLVTDTSFFRNPHYHSPGDRVETLDLVFLSRVSEGVCHLAASF